MTLSVLVADGTTTGPKPGAQPSRILHRTLCSPPVAVTAQGIYVTPQNERTNIDGVGSATVNAIGASNPAVQKAIEDQVGKLTCGSCFKVTSS